MWQLHAAHHCDQVMLLLGIVKVYSIVYVKKLPRHAAHHWCAPAYQVMLLYVATQASVLVDHKATGWWLGYKRNFVSLRFQRLLIVLCCVAIESWLLLLVFVCSKCAGVLQEPCKTIAEGTSQAAIRTT